MSKYSILKGLTKLLPSGEKALIDEGDDIIRALKGLDERQIESFVSEKDAKKRAEAIAQKVIDDLAPRDISSPKERRAMYTKFGSWHGPRESPRAVDTTFFPEEFDRYIDPEEIFQLSKQFRDSKDELFKLAGEKDAMLSNLSKLNPGKIPDELSSTLHNEDVANERFKKIMRQLKKSEKK
jgi:hypothetical protein